MARGRKAARYSTLPPGALRRFALAKGENPDKPANRIFEYVSMHARRGDKLNEKEGMWLSFWLASNMPGASRSEAWTFQASRKQLLEVASPDAVRDWLRKFEEVGLLVKVRDGIKGHGSLYVIAPDEIGGGYAAQFEDMSDLQNLGVENPAKSYPQKGTVSDERDTVSDSLGVGSERENLPHPLNPPLNNPENHAGRSAGSQKEPSRPTCPRCGGHDIAKAGTRYACRDCNIVFA